MQLLPEHALSLEIRINTVLMESEYLDSNVMDIVYSMRYGTIMLQILIRSGWCMAIRPLSINKYQLLLIIVKGIYMRCKNGKYTI